jgi:hypothetical protein
LTETERDPANAEPEDGEADEYEDAYVEDDDDADDENGGGDDGGEVSKPRRQWVPVVALVVALAIAGAVLGVVLTRGSDSDSQIGPEGVPLQNVPVLAPASTTATGAPVDGITCRTNADQKVKYHIHVHVAIFVNGSQRRIPAGVGIPPPQLGEQFLNGLFIDNGLQGCLYWLHVHTNDGVVHVEAPNKGVFTLGQFFDIWNQPLGPNQVGPARGAVVAFVNGKRFRGNPHELPLMPHAVVQLDVGQPVVPFMPLQFHVNGLCGQGKLTCSSSSITSKAG